MSPVSAADSGSATHEILTAPDGGRFNLTRVIPTLPRAAVVMLPGMFTGRRFWLSDQGVGLAAFLADAGHAVYIVERRGIGATRDDAGTGRSGFTEHLQQDLPLVQSLVAQEQTGPVFWIGHSFGGVLAARAVATTLRADQVAGLVLFATQFEVGKRGLDFPGNLFARGVARLLGRVPARWVGLGPEDESPATMTDAGRMVADGRRQPELREQLGRLTQPTLAIVGAGDRVDPPEGCERFVGHFASTDRTFLKAGTHNGFEVDFDHPGIVISKPARAQIWPLVRDWLDARCATRSASRGG